MTETIFPVLYILAAAGFILAIKWMNSPVTARRGVIVGEIGMLLAVIGTLLRHEVVDYTWILIAFFIGSAIGVPLAYAAGRVMAQHLYGVGAFDAPVAIVTLLMLSIAAAVAALVPARRAASIEPMVALRME